jgi:hypothetical protein
MHSAPNSEVQVITAIIVKLGQRDSSVRDDDSEFHLEGPTKSDFPKTLDCDGDLRNLRGRPQ